MPSFENGMSSQPQILIFDTYTVQLSLHESVAARKYLGFERINWSQPTAYMSGYNRSISMTYEKNKSKYHCCIEPWRIEGPK